MAPFWSKKWSKTRATPYLLAGCLVLVAGLCWLGLWQLERAAYKRTLEAHYFDNLAALPLGEQSLLGMQYDQAENPEFAFRTLRLSGVYLGEKSFLLDNQIFRMQVGYRVITVFKSRSGQNYLIDRGWIPAGTDRTVLPHPEFPDHEITLLGIIWPNLGLVPLLSDSVLDEGWPKRIQRANMDRMEKLAGVTVFPYLLRLEAFQAGVFTVLNRQVDFSAERHTAYAVQWFGLALILLAGLIILGRKQGK